jgi:hypothetical protein
MSTCRVEFGHAGHRHRGPVLGVPPPRRRLLGRLVARYGPGVVIVHGGDTGVDESFATAARGLGVAA